MGPSFRGSRTWAAVRARGRPVPPNSALATPRARSSTDTSRGPALTRDNTKYVISSLVASRASKHELKSPRPVCISTSLRANHTLPGSISRSAAPKFTVLPNAPACAAVTSATKSKPDIAAARLLPFLGPFNCLSRGNWSTRAAAPATAPRRRAFFTHNITKTGNRRPRGTPAEVDFRPKPRWRTRHQ